MNLLLLLQQYSAYLFHLIWMVLEMGGGGRTAAALWDIGVYVRLFEFVCVQMYLFISTNKYFFPF